MPSVMQDPRPAPGSISYLEMQSVTADDRSQGHVGKQNRRVCESGADHDAVSSGRSAGARSERSRNAELLPGFYGASRWSRRPMFRRATLPLRLRPEVCVERGQEEVHRRLRETCETKLPHPMPISMMFWAGPGSDSDVIKVASAYEAATHHRVPPPAFGPVPATANASARVSNMKTTNKGGAAQ